MTSQDEITRTADRLKDALGAAADLMAAGDGTVRAQDSKVRYIRWWLFPSSAVASIVAIALVALFVGHPAINTGGRTVTAAFFGPVHLVNASAPDPAVLNSPGVQAARSGVVKITGSAPSCGEMIEGSGFVYAPQHVITAAHDVAGITQGQTVTTAGGVAYPATVVFYDPRADIAVLDVPGLNAAALRFSPQAKPGDSAVVAGATRRTGRSRRCPHGSPGCCGPRARASTRPAMSTGRSTRSGRSRPATPAGRC